MIHEAGPWAWTGCIHLLSSENLANECLTLFPQKKNLPSTQKEKHATLKKLKGKNATLTAGICLSQKVLTL
jgi:hypothetical protein